MQTSCLKHVHDAITSIDWIPCQLWKTWRGRQPKMQLPSGKPVCLRSSSLFSVCQDVSECQEVNTPPWAWTTTIMLFTRHSFSRTRGMHLWENVHLHDFCLFRTLVAKTSQDHWSCLEKTAYRASYSTRVLQLESLPLITQDFLPVSLFTLNLFYLLWPSRFYFVFFSWRVMSCNRSQNMQRLKSISNHLSVLCII